jgi:hypothetical protein
MDIPSILSTLKPDLGPYESLYKNLHRHPGLSLQEHLAAETAAKHLRGLKGFDVRTNIGGTGLIGILHNGEGKTVLLRADTDALPVKELTGLEYASTDKEVDVQDGTICILPACSPQPALSTLRKNTGKGLSWCYFSLMRSEQEAQKP